MALVAEAPTAAQWPKEHYEHAIQNTQPRRVVLVLETQFAIAAFLVAKVVASEWELENIVVSKAVRQQGMGTSLFKEFLSIARQDQGEAIFLEVRKSNTAACSFYEKSGFERTGRRANYYQHPDEDALLYRLQIT